VLACLFCFSYFSNEAQAESTDGTVNPGDSSYQSTTGNLIDPNNWEQTITPQNNGYPYDGNYSDHGGHIHFYHNNANGSALWRQAVGITQALKDQGIVVDGLKYSWTIYNRLNNDSKSNLDARVIVTDDDGNTVYRRDYRYDSTNIGTNVVNELTYRPNDLAGSTINQAEMLFHFQDRDGGYYRGDLFFFRDDIQMEWVYTVDPCSQNPLYDPSCNGYADAHAQLLYDQACTADPLYDTSCPGYTVAYYNQQCSINPLYDSGCVGYADAYYDQQCSLDALYDQGCNGYAAAYLDQQCTLDQLYDEQCPLYEQTYYETYVLPGLEEQTNQAAGLDTDSTFEEFATSDPVESLTEFGATGDATVDSILRDSVDIEVLAFEPDVGGFDVPMEMRDEREEPLDEGPGEEPMDIEIASLEEGPSDREEREEPADETEPSSDVDEQVDSSGDGDSSGSQEREGGEGENDSSGDSESRESSSSADEKKESRRDKMKRAIERRATQLAERMSGAATLEMQKAVQAQVLALINYIPDFTTYGGEVQGGYYPDAPLYNSEQLPESRRGLRNGLAQQLLHEKMVESQYNR